MRVSVVMATRNSAAYLQRALDSIPQSLRDGAADYEILVADGNSSDTTLQIAGATPRVTVVSTSDQGIYDGMNKAMAAATGEYVIILNSDDELLPGGLAMALAALENGGSLDTVLGAVAFGPDQAETILRRADCAMSGEGLLFGIPVINARVFRRRALNRVGLFRTDIGLGADREFMLRVLATDLRAAVSASPLYFYREHAASHTLANDRDGRGRVYASDLQLSEALLRQTDVPPVLRKAIRAFRALAKLKLAKLKPFESGKFQADEISTSARDVMRGVLAHRTWRGRLSGW